MKFQMLHLMGKYEYMQLKELSTKHFVIIV